MFFLHVKVCIVGQICKDSMLCAAIYVGNHKSAEGKEEL